MPEEIVRLPLDPDLERLLVLAAAVEQPGISTMSPTEARRWADDSSPPPSRRRALASVRPLTVTGGDGPIPARLYDPAPEETLPMLVHFHGGGWVLGTLDQADDACRRLATETRSKVISVDYRLAPEHPCPAPCDGAISATQDILARASELGGRPDRIGVSGDSAGGHLAAVAAIALREATDLPPLICQFLIYPVTDCDFTRPSMITNASGRLLETAGMEWFWNHFCPDPTRRLEWKASPIRVADPAGLPPAIIALAAHDPLYSEGIAYARRLQDAGVTTTVRTARDLIHGYYGLTQASARADQEVSIINTLVRDVLHSA